MKKICIITAGGTIGMLPNPETGSLEPAKNPMDFLRKLPDLSTIANIQIEPVMNIDSANMGPLQWTHVANKIQELYSEYDGFVVVQGTDTMAYSATALSFVFQNLNKPIVFTGSLLPAFELGSDAINNLIYATITATLDIAEVCLVFSNKILRANRAKKNHESFLAGFHSPLFPALGELGRPINLNSWRKTKSHQDSELIFKPQFDDKVGMLKLYPGFNPDLLDVYLEKNYKALYIEAFGSGNVPFLDNSVIPKIEALLNANVVVAVGNQMEKGKTNLAAYQPGKMLLDLGAVSNHDMTAEASITKLMWLASNCENAAAIKKGFETDLVGELTLPKSN